MRVYLLVFGSAVVSYNQKKRKMKLQVEMIIGIGIMISSCKTYEGNYCTLPNYTGACIEFLNKRELLYNTATDYGAFGINYGKYQIRRDTLAVVFEEIPEKYKLKSDEGFEIISYEPTNQDSARFDIKCKGAWFANIYCRDMESDSIIFGNTTDLEGELTFKLSGDKLPIILIAEFEKSKVSIPIDRNGNYKINVTLNKLIGTTSYNNLIWTTSKFTIKKNEKGTNYFEQVGNEKCGKFYKYEEKKKTVANKVQNGK